MLERKISDAFTGIKIEESLNSKLNLNFEPRREIDLPISMEESTYRETSDRLSYEIEMGDLNNISESSGIVSGLTSCVNSGSTLPSPREMENHFGEDFGRDRGRLKSAMVSIYTFTLLISYLLLTLSVLLWC